MPSPVKSVAHLKGHICMASPPILSDPKFGLDGWIDCQTFAQVLENQEPVLVVDIRNIDEFRRSGAGIDGTVNVPLESVVASLPDLRQETRRIVVLCQTDRYARVAASFMRQGGILNILVLRGGIDAWLNFRAG